MNRLCPMCGNRTEEARCPHDGTATLVLAQNPDSRLVEGTEVNGRYRVGGIIGQGGFGAVYRATSLATGQAIAIKVLGVSLDSDESELIQRFFAEAQITASLKHPNTIRVFDFGQTEGGALYIAMELLSGQALNDLLRERKKAGTALTQAETLNIASQTLRSLTEAHMKGLVHRDLKPHNIFLNDVPGDDPVVKVLDFGIAKRLGSNLTGTGQAFGTPTYMSPEQAQNRPIDARSDLYSLAVVLYQCIAGACPFEGDNPLAVLLSHVTDEPPDLYERAAHPVSREFADAITRALAKDPDERFAGAVQMRKALEACARAPSQAEWDQRGSAASAAGSLAAKENERTAAYQPISDEATVAGKRPSKPVGATLPPPPTTSPRLSPMPPLSALSASPGADTVHLDVAKSTAGGAAAEAEGGSGFTQAFLHRGELAAAAAASAPTGALDTDDDEPLPSPRSGAGKWIALALLLLLAAGGGWFAMQGGQHPSAASTEGDNVGSSSGAGSAEAGTPALRGDASSQQVAMAPGADAGEAPPDVARADAGAAAVEVDAGGSADATGQRDAGVNAEATATLVRVESVPTGASLQVGGKAHGKTPHALKVEPGQTLRVTLRRSGYREREIVLSAADAPGRTVKLTKIVVKRRPRKKPRTPVKKPPTRKVKSALEERL